MKVKDWAQEIIRCQLVIDDEVSTDLEKEQAEWKINSIANKFCHDPNKLMILLNEVEKIYDKI
ncbi:MAG: hypothetical protein HUJ68_02185 [Clostridia bacterium]|nr:hypothetical protein [Clostridia bacterium]